MAAQFLVVEVSEDNSIRVLRYATPEDTADWIDSNPEGNWHFFVATLSTESVFWPNGERPWDFNRVAYPEVT